MSHPRGAPTADQTLATMVRIANAALTQREWAGEVDLHRVAVVRLLPALAKNRESAAKLVSLQEWQLLAGASVLRASWSVSMPA